MATWLRTLLKPLWLVVENLFLLPYRFIKYYHALLVVGAIEIETRFQFSISPQLRYLGKFKTLIQIDGDQINILPDMIYLPTDLHWQDCLAKKSQQHFAKVDKMLRDLHQLEQTGIYFAQLIGAISGLSAGLLMEKPALFKALVDPLLQRLESIHPLLAQGGDFLLFSLASAFVLGGFFFYLLRPLLMKSFIFYLKKSFT